MYVDCIVVKFFSFFIESETTQEKKKNGSETFCYIYFVELFIKHHD